MTTMTAMTAMTTMTIVASLLTKAVLSMVCVNQNQRSRHPGPTRVLPFTLPGDVISATFSSRQNHHYVATELCIAGILTES
eukprot:m.124695 g.124695  ORF g.124695 m.124695 type:complete len:81 (+) comp15717_c1_seq1:1-243(+)